MQNISFTPLDDITNEFVDPPKPASQFLPKWYKDMPPFIDGETFPGIGYGNTEASNTTLKHCSPFLDALTFGYIWSLPVDVEVRKKDKVFYFRWRTEGTFLTDHTEDQHPGLPAVYDGESFVMKWSFGYKITTPKGYSTFFTHPLNRNELPFRTFSGVVDTDTYPLSVQFPFQLISKDFKGNLIIPKGTPLVQMIPFKRDDWKSSRQSFQPETYPKDLFRFRSTIVKSYKKNFWTKKKFV